MSVLAQGKRTYMRAGDRRAQILACARGVFAERGFHVTSVADLCEAAGIGRGTLYQYFGNKREVFCAVLEEITERVKGVVDTRPQIGEMDGTEQAPPELILAFCATRLRALLDVIFTDEDNLRLILREARGLDGGIDQLVRRIDGVVLSAFVRDLQIARELGVFHCPEPELTALFVLGGVEKMCLTALERDEPVDLDRIVRVATRIQLFGLLSDKTRARNREIHRDHEEEKA
jgi:AcrR family transcriptional regulator